MQQYDCDYNYRYHYDCEQSEKDYRDGLLRLGYKEPINGHLTKTIEIFDKNDERLVRILIAPIYRHDYCDGINFDYDYLIELYIPNFARERISKELVSYKVLPRKARKTLVNRANMLLRQELLKLNKLFCKIIINNQ